MTQDELKALPAGIYRIYWTNGRGASVASIGFDRDGMPRSAGAAWLSPEALFGRRDDIERMQLIEAAPEPMPGTVRVRIAVAVASDGAWSAAGWTTNGVVRPDAILKGAVHDAVDEDCGDVPIAVHFIVADVPMPVSETVEGRVTP